MAGAEPVLEGPPQLAVHGAIATISLCRPSVANRLELEDLAALRTHIAHVNARPEVLVLRLVAQGRHFCSGFNIDRMGQDGEQPGQQFEVTADALERARPVTLAVLQGGAYGGAVDLALACDFRFGAAGASMAVPAARLGLHFYQGGLERFVSRLGLGLAKRILLAGESFDAASMQAVGYLDHLVVGDDGLMAAVDRYSAGLASMAPLALLGMKRHLNQIARHALDADALSRDVAVADHSADLHEGKAAWQQGREPRFTGR